jgi:hypothetical protein
MADAKPTGYVRTIERKDGPVYYAKLKLPDGSQPQRRLGKVWAKRSAAARGLPDARAWPRRGCRPSSRATTRS